MSYKDAIREKRLTQSTKEQSKKDMLTLAYYMKQSNATTPTGLTNKLDELMKSLNSVKIDDSLKSELKDIMNEFRQMVGVVANNHAEHLSTIGSAIEKLAKSLESDKKPPVDMSPVIDAIKNLSFDIPEPKVEVEYNVPNNLSDYKAHDLKDDGSTQYIGFVNPDGKWYIVENDSENNRLRYVFGAKGYSKAFLKAGTWQYKILSEAMEREV